MKKVGLLIIVLVIIFTFLACQSTSQSETTIAKQLGTEQDSYDRIKTFIKYDKYEWSKYMWFKISKHPHDTQRGDNGDYLITDYDEAQRGSDGLYPVKYSEKAVESFAKRFVEAFPNADYECLMKVREGIDKSRHLGEYSHLVYEEMITKFDQVSVYPKIIFCNYEVKQKPLCGIPGIRLEFLLNLYNDYYALPIVGGIYSGISSSAVVSEEIPENYYGDSLKSAYDKISSKRNKR